MGVLQAGQCQGMVELDHTRLFLGPLVEWGRARDNEPARLEHVLLPQLCVG